MSNNPLDFIDRFTSIDNELHTTNQELQNLVDQVEALVAAQGGGTVANTKSYAGAAPKPSAHVSPQISAETESALLQFPAGSGIDESSSNDLGPHTYAGSLQKGKNTIDFTSGNVSFPNRNDLPLSNKLDGLSSDYVRSLYISADSKIIVYNKTDGETWNIPQFRPLEVRNIRSKALEIWAVAPTRIVVYASTNNIPQATNESDTGTMARFAAQPQGTSGLVHANQTWTDILFDTEDSINVFSRDGKKWVDTENVDNLSISVTNANALNSLEISLEGLHREFLSNSVTMEGTTEIPGWTRSNPKTVQANTGNRFDITDWEYSYLSMSIQFPNDTNGGNLYAGVRGSGR